MNTISGYSNSDKQVNTEAIIVLTGGSNRIDTGLELLKINSSKRLFITGVNSNIAKVIDVLKIFSSLPLALQSQIEFGQKATNTFENVLEVKEWLELNKVNSITLVTSSYHIPRSLLIFKDGLPGIGLEAYPVFSNRFKNQDWWKDKKSIIFFLKEYTKYSLVFAKIYTKKYLKELYVKLSANA
jgi:uncharacterized SAM-binding protein YcdF (DUF218 family)